MVHQGQPDANDGSQAVQKMHDMLEKYGSDFLVHHPQLEGPQDHTQLPDTIMVTGTTGSLGCALLAHLVTMPRVSKIYAVNRRGELPLVERQSKSLSERGHDATAIIESSRIVFLEADLSTHMLGLPHEIYEEVNDNDCVIKRYALFD
jgi:hypothetical protein